ncbi:MAG: hypothetical protein ACKOEO_03450 [Planctomycetaceae bacterium]
MATTKSSKPADLATTCRELLAALDKFYGKSQQELPQPMLESMLLIVCLEDDSWDTAKAGYARLLESYFDLNEIRVSSTTELAHTLSGLHDAEWKGLRIRAILRNVFESSYSFDFEKLRRQTPDLTLKTLKKITELSPFVREFILQELLGTHSVALDNSMLKAAQWLGLVPAATGLPDAMELLKAAVRKSDASNFCRQLRHLATDPGFSPRFKESFPASINTSDVLQRLEDLTTGKARKPARKTENTPDPAPKTSKPEAARSTPAPPAAQPKPTAPRKVATPPAKSTTTAPKSTVSTPAPAKKEASAKQASNPAPVKKSAPAASAKSAPAGKKDRK